MSWDFSLAQTWSRSWSTGSSRRKESLGRMSLGLSKLRACPFENGTWQWWACFKSMAVQPDEKYSPKAGIVWSVRWSRTLKPALQLFQDSVTSFIDSKDQPRLNSLGEKKMEGSNSRKGLEPKKLSLTWRKNQFSGYRRQYWCEKRGMWQRMVCAVCDLREFLVVLTESVNRGRCKMRKGGRSQGDGLEISKSSNKDHLWTMGTVWTWSWKSGTY